MTTTTVIIMNLAFALFVGWEIKTVCKDLTGLFSKTDDEK